MLRQAGKSVLILEKTELAGGSTAKAGGVMWIPNNRFMAEAGIAVSYTNVFWGGRSEIKPSEISPKIYEAFHAKWKDRSAVL
mgnify:CR=1 FL=1